MIKNNIEWKWQMDLEQRMEWNAPSLFPAHQFLFCSFSIRFLFFPLFSSLGGFFFCSFSLLRCFFCCRFFHFPYVLHEKRTMYMAVQKVSILRHTRTHKTLMYSDFFFGVLVKNDKKHTFFSKNEKKWRKKTKERCERTRERERAREKAPQAFNTIIYHSKQFLRYLIARKSIVFVYSAVNVVIII